jgi:hypothetical protein
VSLTGTSTTSAKHEHITTRSEVDQIKKVISRHLLSATEDTHRIELQENEVGIGKCYGARNGTGYFGSVSDDCAQTAQQIYYSYQYALHVTAFPQRYLVIETPYRFWPDLLAMICHTSQADASSVYLAMYGSVDHADEGDGP